MHDKKVKVSRARLRSEHKNVCVSAFPMDSAIPCGSLHKLGTQCNRYTKCVRTVYFPLNASSLSHERLPHPEPTPSGMCTSTSNSQRGSCCPKLQHNGRGRLSPCAAPCDLGASDTAAREADARPLQSDSGPENSSDNSAATRYPTPALRSTAPRSTEPARGLEQMVFP